MPSYPRWTSQRPQKRLSLTLSNRQSPDVSPLDNSSVWRPGERAAGRPPRWHSTSGANFTKSINNWARGRGRRANVDRGGCDAQNELILRFRAQWSRWPNERQVGDRRGLQFQHRDTDMQTSGLQTSGKHPVAQPPARFGRISHASQISHGACSGAASIRCSVDRA